MDEQWTKPNCYWRKLRNVYKINHKRSPVLDLPDDALVSLVTLEDMEAIEEGEQDILPQREVSLKEVPKSYSCFRSDDVLLANVSPCFENRKSGIVREVKNDVGFCTSDIYVIHGYSDTILPEYIYRMISSERILTAGKAQMIDHGKVRRLPVGFVSNYEIPLPDFCDQVDLMDEIEGYRGMIYGAQVMADSWGPRSELFPKWPGLDVERKVIDVCRELVPVYEERIKTLIEWLWE